ncbi:DUF2061 domain-containing protein [Paracoccus sp. Z330]|uniref:DUF2061 domain-containing protein n=1 Tax=Paracoccus onchidii TaxID=3017813 RepID=A0ABT4ZH08_9RHOB|nr:DUF2061 domain-containing protein [Paracoccus onchidii]MDB6178649.1 DUF2061 domain-containing protein [Paracoccus onchidii]
METRVRSVTKAVLWQVIGLLGMTAVGLLVTGSVSAAGGMALMNAAIGFAMYLAYERLWQRIQWGRSAR